MNDIAWSIEHSVETTAPLKFAWLFMTNVKNWDDPPAEFRLNGPFVNGTTGTTEMPGQAPRAWRLRDVEPQSTYTLEILLEVAAILCKWTFTGTAEGHTRLTQRIARRVRMPRCTRTTLRAHLKLHWRPEWRGLRNPSTTLMRAKAIRFKTSTPSAVSRKFVEEQKQILRLTTPKLRNVWGPVRSG